MSELVLTLREPPRQRLDLSPLTPDRLSGLDLGAIAAIELVAGNRPVRVGDYFSISPGDPGTLRIVNACDRLDFIGRGMTTGSIAIEGNVGAYLGLEMHGGALRLHGTAGPYAAAGLRGGSIEIDGHGGDFLGGALPGEMKGMSGGMVVIHGDVGARAADRMRRGIIIVEGGAGAHAASRMIAGTLIVLGRAIGDYPGHGMKRGTVILSRLPERCLPSFGDCGRHELGFVSLLLRRLRGRSPALDRINVASRPVRRFAGDFAADGKGEILVLDA